jgi:SAM-dependent methyltransferase
MSRYVGTELGLFAEATNWKRYWQSKLEPFVKGRVLEVGAGNGNNTVSMIDLSFDKWTCLEPDAALANEILPRLDSHANADRVSVEASTLADVDGEQCFDTILYIDVLEHIEDDKGELANASMHLADGGHIVILSPAHQFLFSDFDKQVGHHRRYSRQSINAVVPADLSTVRLDYLDSVGIMASLANRLILKRSTPSVEQIGFWDRRMVPISRLLDPLLFFRVGKSVLGVFRKATAP